LMFQAKYPSIELIVVTGAVVGPGRHVVTVSGCKTRNESASDRDRSRHGDDGRCHTLYAALGTDRVHMAYPRSGAEGVANVVGRSGERGEGGTVHQAECDQRHQKRRTQSEKDPATAPWRAPRLRQESGMTRVRRCRRDRCAWLSISLGSSSLSVHRWFLLDRRKPEATGLT